jgi:hypothetical protein
MGKSLTNPPHYVASKYSHKYWKTIPFHCAWYIHDKDRNVTHIKPTLVPEISWYNCCVCAVTFEATSEGVAVRHLIEGSDRYYCVPNWHDECRELLKLNPLAYENE